MTLTLTESDTLALVASPFASVAVAEGKVAGFDRLDSLAPVRSARDDDDEMEDDDFFDG